MAESLKSVLDNRKKEANINSLQFTVSSGIELGVKVPTVADTRSFVESLDGRVYRDPRFLAFYCKAARVLGFAKVLYLQRMAVDPSVKQPERLFTKLLKQEMEAKA